jgi:enoyl-CoA hydratase
MSSLDVQQSDEGVATITLNEPERRNAITVDLAHELSSTLTELDANPSIRAIVVTGAGDAFCAGADRAALASADELTLRQIYQSFLAVGTVKVPTIAAVNGPAVGAGLNLALACDIRVAGESAIFDTRFLALGVHCGGGASWMLNRAVGTAAASAMLVFGEPVDGSRAERMGLAWKCVPDDELAETAHAMATRVASFEPGVVALTKNTLRTAAGEIDHQVIVELEVGRQVRSFEDLRARQSAQVSSRDA